jgi:AraC-like DNA-binding protein
MVRPEGFAGIELQIGTNVIGDVPRHWHEDYHLCAITGGYGELRYGGAAHRNPAGSLNMVEPGEVHSNHTRHSQGCDFLKLDFDPAFFRMAGAENPSFSSATIDDAFTFHQFVRLHQCFVQSNGPIEREAALIEFLARLLQLHTRPRIEMKRIGREPNAVRMVREYLSENYSNKVELSQLTELTGLSPFYLTRVFTRETGLPPHAFLNQVRILRAKELIRMRMPISHVALETGFADQSHLTRTFKHIVRVSPGAYKRS